jgi:AcrR family transcriptional regulator
MKTVKGQLPQRPSRRERARATQWRMIKAAYRRFCDQGYAGTTMAQIADDAGVAVQTVYFAFHTKSALLSRAVDFAVLGEDEPLPPESQPWYRAMAAEPDLAEAIRYFVDGVGWVTRRVIPIERAARVAADGDPDTKRVLDVHEQWRAEGYKGALEILRSKGDLAPGMSLERATDLLLLLVGPDAYAYLVDDRGWSHAEWVDWTAKVIAEQLFGTSVRSR